MPDNAVSASAKGATYLILLQIGSRAVTFALNQVLLRSLSPELLGTSVQLELFKIGVQYFSRESLRVAAERRSDGGVQASVNLSYLAILANIPLGFLFAQWYLRLAYVDVPYFAAALRVNQLAAFLELCMEPAFTAVQHNMMYKARAAAEGSSVILKTLTVFGLFFWARKQGMDIGVLPFAAGELVNSLTLTTVYWSMTIPVAHEKGFSLFPRKLSSSPQIPYVLSFFSKPLLYLIRSLFFQTGIKWLLTEGDKLLIATLATLESQGMYALSANYGGLIARMIFQPIEISSRNLFANLCASSSSKPGTIANGNSTEKEITKSKSDKNINTAATIIRDILRVYMLVSLLCFAIGPTAAPLILRLILGARWSDSGAGEVLGAYCYYIPFLAINGVSEAFVAATASTKDLRDQTFWMAGFSALFATSAWVFLRVLQMGAKGLVISNCINMGLRIAFNLGFVKWYFRHTGQGFTINEIMPNVSAVGATMVMSSVAWQSQGLAILRPYGAIGELAEIGAIGAVLAMTIAFAEQKFLIECYKRLRS